jgi:uncharacterized membrane protein YphA (DoxX/SURF4 family)
VGGVLLIVGFWTRLAAALQLPIMLSAVVMVHWRQGFDHVEFPLLVLIATLAIALRGPGRLAIDKAARGAPRKRGA